MPRLTTTVRDAAGNATSFAKDFSVVLSDYDRVLTGDVVGGFHVPEHEVWKIDGVVKTDKNVVVEGRLVQGPGDWLHFKNVDESLFEGGGMAPKPNDIGLWIMSPGVWDICGTEKVGWNRTGDDPSWLDSDELRSAPNAVGDYKTFAPFARGSQVPAVTDPWGTVHHTEILNMTRDCGVRGAGPNGRVHVFIHSHMPQRICHCTLQHIGPRKLGKKILGRYGLHYHHCRDGSRGSLIEGVVVRDCGAHAFATHGSHGITLRDTIAFGVNEDAYWWDLVGDDPDTASHDITQDRIVGANVFWIDMPDIAGWFAAEGFGNSIRNSVMVGIRGSKSSDPAGYVWRSNQGTQWDFKDNVAHNCFGNGSWLYFNPTNPSPNESLTVYNCEKPGMHAGAYATSQSYFHSLSFGCRVGLQIKAVSSLNSNGEPARYVNGRFHGTQYAVEIGDHQREHRDNKAQLIDCDLRAPKLVTVDDGKKSGWYDFIRCFNGETGLDVEPADVEIRFAWPDSRHRFQRRDGTAWEMLPDGTWRDIPAFA